MRKILVVDDDALICDLMTIFFEDWPDAEVTCAFDGEQGAQLLAQSHFDLVLIDEILPGLSGTELAAIAADENTPGLLISAHPHVIGQLERYGFPYLAKPFSLEQLLAQSEAIVAAPEESILRVRNAIARMNASVDRRDPPDANGL